MIVLYRLKLSQSVSKMAAIEQQLQLASKQIGIILSQPKLNQTYSELLKGE